MLNTPQDQDTMFKDLTGKSSSFDMVVKKDRGTKPLQMQIPHATVELPTHTAVHTFANPAQTRESSGGSIMQRPIVMVASIDPNALPVETVVETPAEPPVDNGAYSGGYTTGDATVPPANETPIDTAVATVTDAAKAAKAAVTTGSNAKYYWIAAALVVSLAAVFIFGNPKKLKL